MHGGKQQGEPEEIKITPTFKEGQIASVVAAVCCYSFK